MTRLASVDPESLPRARTHAHGVKAWADLVQVSAQTGRNREGRMVSADLVEQYAQALDNVLEVSGLLDDEALVGIEAEAVV